MRVLVFSDSHGVPLFMKSALREQPTADVVYFLGDGVRNVETLRPLFPTKMFIAVRGNCDLGECYADEDVREIGRVRFFAAHGHNYFVKHGIESFVEAAAKNKAKVALFGHTHEPYLDYRDGLYILNPGAAASSDPTYGVVDITDNGIVTNIIHINRHEIS